LQKKQEGSEGSGESDRKDSGVPVGEKGRNRDYIDHSTELFTDDTKPNQEHNIIHIKRAMFFLFNTKSAFYSMIRY
jgi:hypothetical protein